MFVEHDAIINATDMKNKPNLFIALHFFVDYGTKVHFHNIQVQIFSTNRQFFKTKTALKRREDNPTAPLKHDLAERGNCEMKTEKKHTKCQKE